MFIMEGADSFTMCLIAHICDFLKKFKKKTIHTTKEYDSKILQSCSVLSPSKIVLH